MPNLKSTYLYLYNSNTVLANRLIGFRVAFNRFGIDFSYRDRKIERKRMPALQY